MIFTSSLLRNNMAKRIGGFLEPQVRACRTLVAARNLAGEVRVRAGRNSKHPGKGQLALLS